MASHMRHDEEPGQGGARPAYVAPDETSGAYSAGEEGQTISEGFQPLVHEARGGRRRRNRRYNEAAQGGYDELDPYDLQNRRHKRRHPALRVLGTVLIAVGLVLVGVAGFRYFRSQEQYRQQEQINEQLAQYKSEPADDASGAPVVDWASLEAVNPDVVGWVSIPGTTVDYPVYQGENNNTYLRHTATGEYSLGGQVFMDYQNTEPGMLDSQTIVYGHHLLDGSMFKPVADMADQASFDAVPTVWYVDENDVAYELEPLLVYKADPSDTDVRRMAFVTNDDFHAYLAGLLDKATAARADAASLVGVTDHAFTLVTCNYDNGVGRTVLVCVPKAEAAAATAA